MPSVVIALCQLLTIAVSIPESWLQTRDGWTSGFCFHLSAVLFYLLYRHYTQQSSKCSLGLSYYDFFHIQLEACKLVAVCLEVVTSTIPQFCAIWQFLCCICKWSFSHIDSCLFSCLILFLTSSLLSLSPPYMVMFSHYSHAVLCLYTLTSHVVKSPKPFPSPQANKNCRISSKYIPSITKW